MSRDMDEQLKLAHNVVDVSSIVVSRLDGGVEVPMY